MPTYHTLPTSVRGRMNITNVTGTDGAQIATVPVTTWSGGTPTSGNATQSTQANRPVLRTNVGGTGRKGLEFVAGSAQWLDVSSAWGAIPNGAGRIDIIALLVPTAGDNGTNIREICFFSAGPSGGAARATLRLVQTDYRFGFAGRRLDADTTFFRSGDSGTGAVAGAPVAAAFTMDYINASVTVLKNNSSVGTGTAGTPGNTSATNSSTVNIGRAGTTATNYLTGTLLDLFVLVNATDADRALVHSIMQEETTGLTVNGYTQSGINVTGLSGTFNNTNRQASVNWTSPTTGGMKVTRTDSVGNTGSTTVNASSTTYTFTTAIDSAATWVDLTIQPVVSTSDATPTGPAQTTRVNAGMSASLTYTDPSITYGAGWYSGATDKYSYAANAEMSFVFNGTGVTLFGTKDVHHGTADIFIDGNLQSTVSQQNASRVTDSSFFTISGLSNGNHTVKILNKTGTVTFYRSTIVGNLVTPTTPTNSLNDRLVRLNGSDVAMALNFGDTNATVPLLPRLTMSSTGMIQKNGVNFRTGGANIFQLIHNDYPSPRLMTKPEIVSLLDKCVTLGIEMIRVHTMGANVGSGPGHLVTGVSGTGVNPTINYNSAVWDIMDYAVAECAKRGIYMIVPMVDELGYYHGGKRHWVDFRRPGTVSMDYNVKAANSPTQRAAENYYYTDTQLGYDRRKYLADWVSHYNPYTGRTYKQETVIAGMENGNELWTSLDFPSWIANDSEYIKSIYPEVLTVDGAAADGAALNDVSLNSPYVNIHGTHPYSTFGPAEVLAQIQQAAAKNKAYLIGEYPWSKAAAANIEQAGLNGGNNVATMFWSLQNDADLHNGGHGANYGSDDASFYVPGQDATMQAANTRYINLSASMKSSASSATPSLPPAVPSTDSFTGTNGSALNSAGWLTYTQSQSTATIQSNTARLRAGSAGGYSDKVTIVSKTAAGLDGGIKFTLTAPDVTKEFYFSAVLRSQTTNDSIADNNSYRIEISNSGNISMARRLNGSSTAIGSGTPIPGWASNVPVNIEFSAVGSTISVWAWTTGGKPATPTITGTNSALSTAGVTGFVLNGGNPAQIVDVYLDDWSLIS